MSDPRSFGAWLRRERERRGIAVREISDRTKIGAPLLESLERGDVSRWPGGIYRRAFVRSYADAVGLDADLVVTNFERLFPERSEPAPTRVDVPSEPVAPGELRLHLAGRGTGARRASLRRAGADIGCTAAIGACGLVAAGATGFWCATALAAIAFYLYRVLDVGRQPPQESGAPAGDARPSDAMERRPASVVSFSVDPVRASASPRARARRMAAALSPSAIAAASSRRRRALRS